MKTSDGSKTPRKSEKQAYKSVDELIYSMAVFIQEIIDATREMRASVEAMRVKTEEAARIVNKAGNSVINAVELRLPDRLRTLFEAKTYSREDVEKYLDSMRKLGYKLFLGATAAGGAVYLTPAAVSPVVQALMIAGFFVPPNIILIAPAVSIIPLGVLLITMSNDLREYYRLNQVLNLEGNANILEKQDTPNEAFTKLMEELSFRNIMHDADTHTKNIKNLGNSVYRTLFTDDRKSLEEHVKLIHKAGRGLIAIGASGTVAGLHGTIVLKALAVLGFVLPTVLVGVTAAGLGALGVRLLMIEYNFRKLMPEQDQDLVPLKPKDQRGPS